MIYATIKSKRPIIFAFNTEIQSVVENSMIVMGHSTKNYFLSSKTNDKKVVKVTILDKDGFKFTLNYL